MSKYKKKCHYCGKKFDKRRTLYVMTRIKKSKGHFRVIYFHGHDCFKQWVNEN